MAPGRQRKVDWWCKNKQKCQRQGTKEEIWRAVMQIQTKRDMKQLQVPDTLCREARDAQENKRLQSCLCTPGAALQSVDPPNH